MSRMPQSSVCLILLKILGGLSAASGQSCTPRYPAAIPAPGGDDPTQDSGIWYAYRAKGTPTVNEIVSITNFAQTVDPLTGATAYEQYTQIAYSTSAQQPACQNLFRVGTYVVNGMMFGNQAVSSDNYTVIRQSAVNMLYHDYANLVVAYGCTVPNSDGTCDTPIIWADTRVKPSQLSADQMADFDSIINRVFKDYCITTDLLPKQIYDSTQAQCPDLDPPACIGSVIKGFQAATPPNITNGQTTGSPSAAYSTPSSTSGAGCKWPLVVPTTVNYDPATHEGLWYVYRQMWSAEPTATNMRVYWHNLGKGILPLTNRTGNYYWAESTQFDTATATQCNFGYWTGFLGSAGENLGYRFVTIDGRQLPLGTRTIYGDDKYRFDYGCVTPNPQTNTCNDPFIMFSFRADPSLWSESEKAHADNDIMGSAFRQYGCSAKDVQEMLHPQGKPQCSFEGGTACVRQYIAGFRELVEPVKVSYY